MSQRPNNTIQNCIEVALIKWEQSREIEFNKWFKKCKKICPNFRKRIKITSNQRERWSKNHLN